MVGTYTRIFSIGYRLQMKRDLYAVMRCLHCGSTLSALKKFTDADFCSTEHRDLFFADHQRLIVERLKSSAARFQRLRRGGAGPDPTRATTPTVVVEQAQAPAPMGAFLYPQPEFFNRGFNLLYISQVNPELGPAKPQSRPSRPFVSAVTSALIRDLPWPL